MQIEQRVLQLQLLVSSQPFVGWKHSGSTGKGAGGEHYLEQFMRAQTQTRCD